MLPKPRNAPPGILLSQDQRYRAILLRSVRKAQNRQGDSIVIETGKTLAELTYEVDVLHKYIVPLPDNGRACISWQERGTLTYFDDSGYPAIYWQEGLEHPQNKREDYTSLERFIDHIKRYWGEDDKLLTTLWCVYDDGVEAFNGLLGDIKIDL
jgi:hypothetical protein